MNILIFTSLSRYSGGHVGGAEISLQLIAEKMARLNENVIFFNHNPSRIPGCRKQHIKGVTVYSLAYFRWPHLQGRLFSKAREQFIAYQRRKCIKDIIVREKIDIVYSYDTIIDTYDILKAKEIYQLNVKVVKRVSGLFWAHMVNLGKISKEHVEWVFNSVDGVNFLTTAFKELVFQTAKKYDMKLMPKKEIILDIGIDLGLFQYQWRPKREKVFSIVCVSRFSPYQKRQDLLIEALSRVKNTNFTVDFIGDGEGLKPCQMLCHQLAQKNRFIFHGYLPPDRIKQILSEADLFVLPSNYEGLPKSLLEAMAIGVPCLVSDVMPLNHYIQDGINGYLVLNTPDQWANKIENLCQMRDKMIDISLRGREFVTQRYDADKNIIEYQKEFRGVVNGKQL